MPAYGPNSKMMDKARTALDMCRFAYKMYAQTLWFPLDPFFETYGIGANILELTH
jgi:hypothetical protein